MTKELLQEDKQELLRLLRVVSPSGYDMEQIYSFYKKYIYDKAAAPTIGCNSCPGSIVTYWKELGNWYTKNYLNR